MTSIALVLGAGGLAGAAYETGVLAALAEVTGWDARSADLLVGTSAGSSVSASLRLGLSPGDQYARTVGAAVSEEGRGLLGPEPSERQRLPARPVGIPLGLPMAPWLVAPAFLQPGALRPALAIAGFLPAGTHDPAIVGDAIRRLGSDRWPDEPTWICAVRVRDGRRVVLGRDDVPTPDLATAVEASCAVTGYFRPVPTGTGRLVDGGVWSTSNADLVAGLGFDLAVVVAPMSVVPPDPPWAIRRWARTIAAGVLRRELGRVTASGTPVLDLSPGVEEAAGFGPDLLDHETSPHVAMAAREATRRRLSGADVAREVALLRDAAAPPVPAGQPDPGPAEAREAQAP